ncbi:MAG: DNA topoisomerase IV subunit A [Gammaproteobacteria bacterium]|uniref:DNA topoisomerase IV subunit A n=1 Tax=Limnobacter sp. TaxID=2003368 RepID=UPI001DE14073|nr:DNA topoisomerase IV subunit A [Limnobacter sp.]MBU0782661.1 DNA topoisomerase IV subunit A [Gammaproteobacteria bacterium]MBU0850249.1 DNA topoisomerase IV subunit A [Gammaproteobacteria bacterium]MBU1780780.1 DNA topoisomerase IV subunit A [Gammaproteobacteria bacterium]MBU2087401.1 DNA topoisomerase IV subunit A [Gammaproteobacteria bacterium]MBU2129293.1 DNA topoisomerase IV subunit A [Gammaproteobacteria bacterium]
MEQLTLDATPPSGDDSETITLGLYAERAYLDYAISVVKGRALPECSDGQKPVQRRILYAMNEMGLANNAKPVKSARVVGDVLGKYHPHGDQAAYDALVRMAQNFTLRYPLIDGQGNFGSRDGDGAAAMRYTEARLTPIAKLLLDEVDMGTVDFIPNYDGSFQEPKLLPARLPFVLLNGASGIAVGMATDIPPHNIREVAAATIHLIKHPNADLDTIMGFLPAPDFPGGAQIISPASAMREIYAGGRGSIKVRARWEIEEMARGQWQLVVKELPPNTSTAKVLEEIEELTNPKVKAGKKGLSTEQQNLKAQVLAMLDAVRDESGKENAVRLVFEPKSRNVSVEEFSNLLLSHTSLEINTSINLVSIDNAGRPGQRGLIAMLLDWIEFRKVCVTRRSQHRLGQVNDRIHVLEGRLIAWLNIDEVIKVIRESDEPKPALIEAFKLSDRQAEDILEIRLRQLARLEKIKIEQELAKLGEEKADLEALLADDGKLKTRIIGEIRKDTDTYGDDRRTLIEEAVKASIEVKVVEEPTTVIVSQKFWIRNRQGHGHDAAQFSFKVGDALQAAFECKTTDNTYLFGAGNALGKVFSVPVAAWPGGRGDGIPAQSLVELNGGTLSHALAAPATQPVFLASSAAYGFLATAGNMESRMKAGKQFISLNPGEKLLPPVLLRPTDDRVAVLAESGRFHVFMLDELKQLSGGGRGVQLLPLDDKDSLVAAIVFGPADSLVLAGTGRGGKDREEVLKPALLAERLGKRGRKGKELDIKFKADTLRKVM